MFRKFKIFFCLIVFGVTVFSGGYIFLDSRLNSLPVTEKAEGVPYYDPIPDNAAVIVDICGEKRLFNLDFETKLLTVLSSYDNEDLAELGYTADYTIRFNYEVVGFLVDSVGGIELLENEEVLRFTGVQIAQMLTFSNTETERKNEILNAILTGISKEGITKETLLYVLENSETDLKYTVCFSWCEHLKELCGFVRYVG